MQVRRLKGVSGEHYTRPTTSSRHSNYTILSKTFTKPDPINFHASTFELSLYWWVWIYHPKAYHSFKDWASPVKIHMPKYINFEFKES